VAVGAQVFLLEELWDERGDVVELVVVERGRGIDGSVGLVDGDVGLAGGAFPVGWIVERTDGLFDEDDGPMGGETGQKLLGSLKDEVPAEMAEDEDGGGGHESSLLV
jgi:hypothetical protein